MMGGLGGVAGKALNALSVQVRARAGMIIVDYPYKSGCLVAN